MRLQKITMILRFALLIAIFWGKLAVAEKDSVFLNYTGQVSVNNSFAKSFLFENSSEVGAYRINFSSLDSRAAGKAWENEFPIFIVVEQNEQIMSWQIPFFVDRDQAYLTSERTLCPDEFQPKWKCDENGCMLQRTNTEEQIVIKVTTLSRQPMNFSVVGTLLDIDGKEENKFELDIDSLIYFDVSPSSPRVFSTKVPDNVERIMVELNSNSTICAYLSVHPSQCPISDLVSNINYGSYYQTVTLKGAIDVDLSIPPFSQEKQFFIIVLVLPSDNLCKSKNERNATQPTLFRSDRDRLKNFSLKIIESISSLEYILAFTVPLGVYLCFIIGTILVIKTKICKCVQIDYSGYENLVESADGNAVSINSLQQRNADSGGIDFNIEAPEIEPSLVSSFDPSTSRIIEEEPGNATTHNPFYSPHRLKHKASINSENSSLDEQDVDFVNDHASESSVIRSKPDLHVADLCLLPLSKLKALDQQYPMSLITAVIFYSLPAAQLVLAYQLQLQHSGNEDLCYYNFRCSHPFKIFSDFNHIISNMGYIILGVLFLLIVLSRGLTSRKEKKLIESMLPRTVSGRSVNLCEERGLPEQFGLLYSLGLALIVEGFMSAAYHVCPNRSNFQFDTAFMYLIAGLGTLRLYQSRHPDIHPKVNGRSRGSLGV